MTRLSRDQAITEEVVYAIQCDNCVERADVKPGRYVDAPQGWATFSSHHNDWGNDSIESSEQHDVCSWACYLAIVRRVFDDYGEDRVRTHATLVVDGHDWAFLKDMLESVAP